MAKMQMNETRERQHAHHAAEYSAYRDELHAEVNQARRLMKHLSRQPHDECAIAALRALPMEALQRVPHALETATGSA